MFRRTIRVAVASLLRHRLRSGLTVLGVGIGIAAVICTAALGAAGTIRVEEQMDAIGDDFLWIRAGSQNVAGVRSGFGAARTLTAEDSASLVSSVSDITACSPQFSGREQLIAGGNNWNTRYQAVLPAYFGIRRRTTTAGVTFTEMDVDAASRVIVLGPVVAMRLFGSENPVGRLVRFNRFPFQVIGVLAPRGAERGGVDRDDVVFVPLTTAVRNLDRREWVTDIQCAVASPALMDRAEAQAVSLLRMRHGLAEGEADDFQIQKPLDVLELRAASARTMTVMLTSIGLVSLVVGGVGIMNIMLVSVTERRREIGVRLAIGARVRDIRLQFLLEAAIIGAVGGAVGVAVGWMSAGLLSAVFEWRTVVSSDVILVAVAAAVGLGVASGYYPAHRASSLDPIDAIHAEA